jgi:thiosulfate/3-mercaptopyruvate sulfurtransferase
MHTDYVKGGWRAKKGTVPGMLPPVEELERLIGEMGIDGTTHVVVAPLGENAKSMAAATRVYWTFKLLGHDRVSILNGGTRGYAADKSLPLETGTATRASKEFIARLRPEMIADHEQVAKAAADGVAYDGSMAQWSRLDERPVEQKVVVAD